MPLQVGIIGAGIGGLSAAIALRRAGAEIEVFEKSGFKHEVGAAITITPNGMRVYDRLGLDLATTARGVVCNQLRVVHASSLDPLATEDFRQCKETYGQSFMFFHRVDLHRALREAATGNESSPGVPAKVRLANSVVDVDCESGRITLANGEVVVKDLVIIADGHKSPFVGKVIGKEQKNEETGESFFRCLVPMKDIMEDEKLRNIWENVEPGYWVPFDRAEQLFVVCYECRDSETLNVALRHKTLPQHKYADNWETPAPIEDILEFMKTQDPRLTDLIKKTDSAAVYKLWRREPLETYHKGRAVIIGDAAHPFSPTHALGAVLAIEEAGALGVLLQGVKDGAEVQERLEVYDKVMKPWIHVVQLLSDATPGMDGDYRKRAEALWDKPIFPVDAMHFSGPVRDFFYPHDACAEMEKELAAM